jgi:HemY protein
MRAWFWTFILVVAAVGLAIAVRDYSGNVALLVPPYRVEVSLTLAILFLVVLFAATYVLLRALAWTTGLPTRVRAWREQRAQAQQQIILEQGWIHLLQGRFARSERDMAQVADQSKTPVRQVLALLSSAQATHAMQEYARRDALLARVRTVAEGDPALSSAVSIVEAELLLEQQRPAEALALLEPLHEGGQRHVHSLRLALRAHRDLGHWAEVLKLARTLAKRNALHAAASHRMIAAAASERLRSTSNDLTRRELWKDLKEDERVVPEVALAAAGAFEDGGDPVRARAILEAAIQVNPTQALWHAYARTVPAEVKPRLEKAEAWLQQSPVDADLLQTLGALCLNGKLWGASQRYLERSLSSRPDPRTHALLAALFDRIGKPEDARRHWQQATVSLVDLPALDAPPSSTAVVIEPMDVAAPDRAAGL